MATAFVLAHLSDPHLGPLPRPRLAELASKRLLGYANWRRGRHRIHRGDVLDAIARDLHHEKPDHVAVTGDLVNISLASEFAAARRWLDTLGPPTEVSLVPGNHDAYVAAAASERDPQWAPYMAGDAIGADAPSPHGPSKAGRAGGKHEAQAFPYLRRRGPVALVGLSTAVPTSLLMATGWLGDTQIAHAAKLLGALRSENLFRVVMIHHPPVAPASAHHKRLVDARAFRAALAAVGAELVIHGHDHVQSLAWIEGNAGRIPVIGVPSASAAPGYKHEPAAYNLYCIGGSPGAWRCEVVTRAITTAGVIGELRRFPLSWTGQA
jgi:3',5'-cyclic AMP phosphodiesterase CpdA